MGDKRLGIPGYHNNLSKTVVHGVYLEDVGLNVVVVPDSEAVVEKELEGLIGIFSLRSLRLSLEILAENLTDAPYPLEAVRL